MVRRLLPAVALSLACGASVGDGRVPVPRSTGSADVDRPGGGDACVAARALERDCVERLAPACEGEDEAACLEVCHPFLARVREVCADAAPGPCESGAAEVEACFDEAAVSCAQARDDLVACDAQAAEVCDALEGGGRDDPDLVAACIDATAACWEIYEALSECRRPCDEMARAAILACGGAP